VADCDAMSTLQARDCWLVTVTPAVDARGFAYVELTGLAGMPKFNAYNHFGRTKFWALGAGEPSWTMAVRSSFRSKCSGRSSILGRSRSGTYPYRRQRARSATGHVRDGDAPSVEKRLDVFTQQSTARPAIPDLPETTKERDICTMP
jgi:hypothetical protein